LDGVLAESPHSVFEQRFELWIGEQQGFTAEDVEGLAELF